MPKSQRFRLGEQVRITGQAIKDHVPMHGPQQEARARYGHWDRVSSITTYVQYPAPAGHGVIVGKRTITDYRLYAGGYEEPSEAVSIGGSSRTAWLVAWDLHRKPLICLDGQVAPWPA